MAIASFHIKELQHKMKAYNEYSDYVQRIKDWDGYQEPVYEMTVYIAVGIIKPACKIGVTRNIERRIVDLNRISKAAFGTRLKMIAAFPGDGKLERSLHDAFASQRIKGEWFRLEGGLWDIVTAIDHSVAAVFPRDQISDTIRLDKTA